jgi:hypothetical protein
MRDQEPAHGCALTISDDHWAATLTAQVSSMTFLYPDGHPRALLVFSGTPARAPPAPGRNMSARRSRSCNAGDRAASPAADELRSCQSTHGRADHRASGGCLPRGAKELARARAVPGNYVSSERRTAQLREMCLQRWRATAGGTRAPDPSRCTAPGGHAGRTARPAHRIRASALGST